MENTENMLVKNAPQISIREAMILTMSNSYHNIVSKAWLCLTNTPKLSESKYQAGFGVIKFWAKLNPLTFMIPIYSTTVLYDMQ